MLQQTMGVTEALDISKCLLARKADLSLKWVEDRLTIDKCDCPTLNQLNLEIFHCHQFPVEHGVPAQVLYVALVVALIVLSCAGNIAVAWIVIRHKQMVVLVLFLALLIIICFFQRTVTNYYLLNLALSDLSITILNTGFSGSYNLYYHWIFSAQHCAFNNLMGITPICASVFTMIAMSIDRYMAIVYPLRRKPGHRKTITIILCIWFLAFLCGLPALLISTVEENYFISQPGGNDTSLGFEIFINRLCMADKFPDGDSRSSMLFSLYNNSLVIIQYLLPLIILSFTYGRVAYVLRQKTIIGDTRHNDTIKAKRKVANMLALVVFTFIIMWLPYNVYFLLLVGWLQSHLTFHHTLHLYMIIYMVGMSSCLMNPVIYYFMNERFRLGFRYFFRWLPCVRVKKEDYQNVFSGGSRVSYPTATGTSVHSLNTRFSVTNTTFTTSNSNSLPHRPKTSLQHNPNTV